MRRTGLYAVLLLACLAPAQAAPPATTPPYVVMDSSSEMLMDKATALAMWKEHLPMRLGKLYPVGKWGFLSQVEGGFDDAKVCIVTARATLLPRSGKALLFVPAKTAIAIGSQANASAEQCRALAKAKLGEAMVSIRSALLPR